MAFKLKEMDGEFGEVLAGLTEWKPMVLWKERECDYQVWVEPDYLHIENLKVYVFSGGYYSFSRATGTYEIDHDVYYFFNPSTGRLVYSEYGSDLMACVRNFIRESGKKVKCIEELSCTYALDNGKFLRKKVLPRKKL